MAQTLIRCHLGTVQRFFKRASDPAAIATRVLTLLACMAICGTARTHAAPQVLQPTVIAFSSQNPYGIDRAATRSRDASGLATGPSGMVGGADATHGNVANATMWTSRGNTTAAPNDAAPTITFDLGAPFDLTALRIWAYNENSFTRFGAKDIRVSTSVDNTTFTTPGDIRVAQGGGTPKEPAQDFPLSANGVRYLKLQILTNWDGASFWSPITGSANGGTDGRWLVGLSELRILGSATPPPVPPANTPSPANGASGIETNTALAWDTGDATGSITGCRVVVGVGDPAYGYEVESTNLPAGTTRRLTWQPPAGVIQTGSSFWWRVDQTTATGAAVTGPVWTFTTRAETAAEKDARMAWFRHDKLFGAIVWGLYSGAEGVWPPKTGTKQASWTYAEWMQFWMKLDTLDYRNTLEPLLTGESFDAANMAKLCKQAGMTMVYVMPRHHDGYALWNTATTTTLAPTGFKVAGNPANPRSRDYLKELVDALRAEGLRVGFYFSLGDWHHPDFPRDGSWAHPREGQTVAGTDWTRYQDYLYRQVREIVDPAAGTDYGRFDVVYFDYSSAGINGEQWGASRLVHLVRRHHPHIIINNRLWNGLDNPNGDYATPEANVDNVGYNEYNRDWEAIMSANDPPTWGYGRPDLYRFKSPAELVRDVVDVTSKGGTIELSVSPKGDGSLHPDQVAQYAGLGAWMEANGASIRGTTGNPVASRPAWGEYTAKRSAQRLFLHVFRRPADGTIVASGLTGKVRGARLLARPERTLTVTPRDDGFGISLPAELADPINTVIEVDYEFPREVTIAAASSENVLGLDRGARRAVDGSGLSGTTHADGETGVAWTSVGNLGPGTDFSPSITFDLGAVVDVESIRQWGYNTSFATLGGTPMKRIGPKDVDVFTSTDGTNFTAAGSLVFAEATGAATYAGQLIAVDYRGVRYLRLAIRSNHDGAVFDGLGTRGGSDGRSLTGLSEIRFGIAPVPPPRLASPRLDPGGFRVTASGLDPSRRYRMTRSTDLSDGFAPVVDGPRLPAAATDEFADPAPPPGRAFYRVEESP